MKRYSAILVAALVVFAGAANAKDKVRLVDSQATVFDHFAVYQAEAEGYFDAANLDVSIVVGRGGAESLQAVLTGSADVIFGAGFLGVITAYAKGAPVVVVGNVSRGAGDVYWYVRKDSLIRSFKDLDGRELTFTARGSYTNLVAETISRELGIKPKMIATGGFAATRTQLMTRQVETGFARFPANLDLFRSGEARIIGTGDESALLRGMTTRVVAANPNWLAKNHDVAVRIMAAIWRGQQYNFSGRKALERYAQYWKLDIADAERAGDFFKFENTTLSPVSKLDEVLRLALEYDFIKAPPTNEQRKGLINIIYDGPMTPPSTP